MRTSTFGASICLLVMVALAGAQDPGRSPPGWDALGLGGGGAQFRPSFSPHDKAEVWVASDMGHLQRSNDLARSLKLLDFRQITPSHDSRVIFTSDRRVVYCVDFRDDVRRLKVSHDGGSTWSFLAKDPTGGEVWSAWADPNSTQRLLVTSYTDLYYSSDGGKTFARRYREQAGLYVAGVFWDGSAIYVGTGRGLVLSRDGGKTFVAGSQTGIPAKLGFSGFGGARAGTRLRLYAVTSLQADLYPSVTGAEYLGYRGVYTLDLGASAWKRAGRIHGHAFYLATARGKPDVAWLGGTIVNGRERAPGIWRTSDGGKTWQQTFRSLGNANIRTGWQGHGGDRGWNYGEYALGLATSPLDDRVAMFTDLGGHHLTTDAGKTWRATYVDARDLHPAGKATPKFRTYRSNGAQNTAVWWLCWSKPGSLLAGMSDLHLMRSTDAGRRWSLDFVGLRDNMTTHLVRHANGAVYAGTSTAHDLYQSTFLQDRRLDPAGGRVVVTRDHGRTWTLVHDFGDPVVWLALDPRNAEVLYASVINHAGGTGGIWRTDRLSAGARSKWVRLASPPRTEGHPFNLHVLRDGTLVATYSARRNGKGAFTPSSGVFVSMDGGASWKDRSHADMRWWTKDLVVDPHDAAQRTFYVGVWSGWGGPPNDLGGLFRTTDRGQTWQRILTLHRVSSCAVDPAAPGVAYVTTETKGLWFCDDIRVAKPRFQQLRSFPFRQPERVFFDPYDPCTIWVTTFGYGVFRSQSAWVDLGHGKAGGRGVPQLRGCFRLKAGSRGRLLLRGGVPSSAAVLALSERRGDVSLFGGTLVPFPVRAVLPFALDGLGRRVLPFVSPGLAMGTRVYAQAWLFDAGATFGVSASNGLAGTAR